MLTIDTHCDALYMRAFKGDMEEQYAQKILMTVTPESLRAGNVSLQILALFAGSAGPGKTPTPQEAASRGLRHLHELSEDAGIPLIKEYKDVRDDGVTRVMLSVEGAEVFGGSLETFHEYYEKGVRMVALTWNHVYDVGYPHCDNGHRPLQGFGKALVKEMNRLGVAVDVSHLGEGGFWDLIEHADKPPMASHSCCRALHPPTRNLTDDQIRALIDKGGWIGINFYPGFLTHGTATTADVARHINHIVELGGAKHVGFGSDFDGIERTPADLTGPQDFPHLIDVLAAQFGRDMAEGFAGRNFMEYTERL